MAPVTSDSDDCCCSHMRLRLRCHQCPEQTRQQPCQKPRPHWAPQPVRWQGLGCQRRFWQAPAQGRPPPHPVCSWTSRPARLLCGLCQRRQQDPQQSQKYVWQLPLVPSSQPPRAHVALTLQPMSQALQLQRRLRRRRHCNCQRNSSPSQTEAWQRTVHSSLRLLQLPHAARRCLWSSSLQTARHRWAGIAFANHVPTKSNKKLHTCHE